MIDERLIHHLLEFAPTLGPLVRQDLSWRSVPAQYVQAEHSGSLTGLFSGYCYYLDSLAKVIDHHHDIAVPVFRLRKRARSVDKPAVNPTHYG